MKLAPGTRCYFFDAKISGVKGNRVVMFRRYPVFCRLFLSGTIHEITEKKGPAADAWPLDFNGA